LIFYDQVWGEVNAAKSLLSLDVVSVFPIREDNGLFFLRVCSHSIESESGTKGGPRIADYYSRMFGLFGYPKSHFHFSKASRLYTYSMKPNFGIAKVYRLLHLVGKLRTALEGDAYEEKENYS
jgi:hypothetical protein